MKILGLILCVCFAANSFASPLSPLIFKVKKDILTDDLAELVTIDTSKYSNIRIAIVKDKSTYATTTAIRSEFFRQRVELQARTNSLIRDYGENHPNVTNSKRQLDRATDRLTECFTASYFSIEDEEIDLGEIVGKSFVINNPPTKMKIKVRGKGSYRVYIYGQ